MNPQRTFTHVLLALLLLLSQQMGLSHAVSHWSDLTARSQSNQPNQSNQLRVARGTVLKVLLKQSSKQILAEQICEECLVFAQIGTALNTSHATFPTSTATPALLAGATTQILDAKTVCGFHSRAPPVIG